MKTKLTAVKAHVSRNRAKYAVATTLVVLVVAVKVLPRVNETLSEIPEINVDITTEA